MTEQLPPKVEFPTVLTNDNLVPLEAILCTEELSRRPPRPPDYETENRAMAALAQALADSPRTILQTLADTILTVFKADSAGLSLLTKDEKSFYWAAIAGAWQPHLSGATPRNFGPCGDVLDRNIPLLFRHWEQRYPYLLAATPLAEEGLLVPFHVQGKAVGTIWAIAHDDRRKFDAEDLRQLQSLGRFASSAYQAVAFIDAVEQQSEALRQSAQHVAEVQVAQDSRRAALNLLEDAVQSRQATDRLNVQLRESEERLARELTATRQLQSASALLIEGGDTDVVYEKIVDAAVAIMGSDCASMQMLYPERAEGQGELLLLAQYGFTPESAKTFRWVGTDSGSTCGEALRTRSRIIAPDVETALFIIGRPGLEGYRQAGIRSVQSTPLFSRDGQLLGMISTHWHTPHTPAENDLRLFDILARQAADLMERKQTAEALRESEERFRSLVSVITDVTWVADAAGAFITPQSEWEAYTGQTWEQHRGFGWVGALHPDDRERVKEIWNEACADAKIYQSEGRLWHAPTQDWRHFIAKATPLLDGDGSVREWVGTYTDIDDRKRFQRRLERTVAERTTELQQANVALLRDMEERKKLEEQLLHAQKMESVGTLAGGIAHDFNNVLNIIQGYAFALREYGARNKAIGENLTVIEESVLRGSILVQQLLTLARKSSTKLESVNANTLIAGVIRLITQTFPKTINLSSALEADLPPVTADKNQIEQVLLNLCVNARDAMPNGGSLIFKTQTVDGATLQGLGEEALEEERYVCIEVSDTGTGMDESTRKRIFEPFFTTKDIGHGTGLGLSVVYGIVKNHKGFIDVESKPMSGTSFRLYFPIALAAEKPATDMIAKPISEPKEAANGVATILLVEDEKIMLDLLEKVLRQQGYRIFTATDGEQALDVYRRYEQKIDIVLLDIGLPKLGGRDVLLQIKNENPDVKVVVASGHLEPELKSEIDQAGVEYFLPKPYTPDEVIKTLQRLIARES